MQHNNFLRYVLNELQKKETDFTNCTFVLPSKRSGTFLKKQLSTTLEQHIFCPEILSIQDFVAQISGLTPASNLELLLILFQVYKDSEVEKKDDFSSFIKWGQTLLHDFNEIDGYLIPSHDILNYLSAIKELNHWSLKKDKTELVTNYIHFWKHIEPLYNSFTSTLLSKKRGYQGLISKVAVDKLASYHKTSPIVFVGFNALNTSESKIVQYFLEQGNGEVYWDIDSHFYDDPIHDAGLFIREYIDTWPYYEKQASIKLQNEFLSNKTITITGVPKSVSQTKYVGQLLQQIKANTQSTLENTALVLADENLLQPMLKAIPKEINQVNITMGLPLNKTILYSFFNSLLELNISKSDKGWFYKQVLEFLSNPYTLILSSLKGEGFASKITQEIKEKNWLYINTAILSLYSRTNSAIQFMFSKDNITPNVWTANCLQLINILKDYFQQKKKPFELEQLYRFYTLFNQLNNHIDDKDHINDLQAVKSLFKQLASIETLDFIGEPLNGLQLMGMLESRNLDFETVIITSVNEGILPSGKSNNSFIPFDVKRDYGLPTYKEKDAIYTYHFYRLLQRAKNVHIIYNTEPDVLEGGEKSRLINQLLTDEKLAPYITHKVLSPKVSITPFTPEEITKGDSLFQEIKAFAKKGFSPTSLTNYIKNPVDFYTRNILKINDVEEVEENIAANTFGTVVHDSLEELYTPLIGLILTKENVTSLKPLIPKVVKGHFQKNLSGVDTSKGKFLLVYNVIQKYLNNFIDLELKLIQKHQIKILALEEKHEILVNIEELDFPIKLKGTLDRVDTIDDVTRIVDYKTGRVESKNVKISDWDELITNYDKSKAFQLLCYGLLFSKKHHIDHISAGIYSFKNLGQGFFPFQIHKGSSLIDAATLGVFEDNLKKLILEICNTNIPFMEKQV
ncbi:MULTISPECIES: PD-(D/E)XK nuclease family protein [Flavobacteriaceae]|uniref:PD-(D/E)XK nuclease family protein n=1 Tax=Flavobacteriaceae TaxID=49546 RepID=UPI001491A2FB|nr:MULTISPECIES: PD-(D/E)XK nuclease family protein [Allomuricauda]MDC6365249.1 PD-(D/E)XK nuclease family protein [Muricauda sp. AC10]